MRKFTRYPKSTVTSSSNAIVQRYETARRLYDKSQEELKAAESEKKQKIDQWVREEQDRQVRVGAEDWAMREGRARETVLRTHSREIAQMDAAIDRIRELHDLNRSELRSALDQLYLSR